jgi:hypothetical protein
MIVARIQRRWRKEKGTVYQPVEKPDFDDLTLRIPQRKWGKSAAVEFFNRLLGWSI